MYSPKALEPRELSGGVSFSFRTGDVNAFERVGGGSVFKLELKRGN